MVGYSLWRQKLSGCSGYHLPRNLTYETFNCSSNEILQELVHNQNCTHDSNGFKNKIKDQTRQNKKYPTNKQTTHQKTPNQINNQKTPKLPLLGFSVLIQKNGEI